MAFECDMPVAAWLVALADLPKMGPARMRALLNEMAPADAWSAVASQKVLEHRSVVERMGSEPRGLAKQWSDAAAQANVEARWAQHAGIVVAAQTSPEYPAALCDDPEPPALLFMAGDIKALNGPTVAIVGTRRCTRAGFETAKEFGQQFALSGIRVVSGLALGIDGAAHRGALDAGPTAAPPIGVVASGVDVVYPKSHRALWQEVVAAGGLLISESPLGTQPETWRFPARNRIIAGLSQAVVVIESPGQGGSMYTVEAALERDIPVFAVPGSVRSAASAGTNQLIFDGAQIARNAADVLGSLGFDALPIKRADERSPASSNGRRVLRALGWEPATLGDLATRSKLELGSLSVALGELEGTGWVERRGLWFERIGAR